MKKEDLTVLAILAEAVGVLLGILYIGLQIFYGINYHVAPYKYICNIAGFVLVYAGLTILSNHPERINRIPEQMCVGKIRIYSLRMLRLVKLIFVVGLMIPCVADVIGRQMQDAYSLIIIGLLLLVTIYYEYKIILTIRKNRDGKN